MELFPNNSLLSIDLRIDSITQISPDSKIFTFALPSPDHCLGLRPGQHLALSCTIKSSEYPEGKEVRRKYTPTTRITHLGTFEIPIKIYYPTETFPGGKLTTHLDKLTPGSTVKVTGPIGKFIYEGNGICYFKTLGTRSSFKKLGFIAGGSGITPCFQYIQYIIDHNEDIELSLIYANKTENDIWLKENLENFREKCKVFFTVDIASSSWTQGVGFVNESMIRAHLPSPDPETCIFFCGPSPMNRMLRELLPSIGYSNFTKF
jgi:NAD(P)H-flavin reductase